MLRRRTTAAALLAAAALAAGCSSSPAPRAAAPASAPASPPAPAAVPPSPTATAQAGRTRLAWRSCEGGFECAELTVPLGAAPAAADVRVQLAVTRLRASGPGRRVGSLFVNPGGPGASAVEYLQAAYAGLPQVLREHFDLVAFDPRGVGRSTAVRCATTAQLDRLFALDPSPDDVGELDALEEGSVDLAAGCAQRSGALLAHVSTAEAAQDLDRLRAAVGDRRLTYLGYSYGTSIGAAYLDAYPRRVRAMVLDGALDPALSWKGLLEGQSRGFDHALDAMLADCERIRCAFRQEVSGSLPDAYDALAARVDRAPLPGADGRTLGPGEMSLGVGAGLYDREQGWPVVEQGLAAAQRGDGRILLALSDSYLGRSAQGYENISEANAAVNCLDRPWPRDRAAYVALADGVRAGSPRFGPAIALSGLSCVGWPVPATGTPHQVRGAGSPPVVVIGTTGDPATPYAWSASLARQLDAGVLLTHVGEGHTVFRTGAPACIVDPVDDYLVSLRRPAQARC